MADADLLGIGQHCSHPGCQQLDFLPFQVTSQPDTPAARLPVPRAAARPWGTPKSSREQPIAHPSRTRPFTSFREQPIAHPSRTRPYTSCTAALPCPPPRPTHAASHPASAPWTRPQCDCCKEVFCLDHRTYSAHACPASGSKQFEVFVCPL
jgi:hypothetical protein